MRACLLLTRMPDRLTRVQFSLAFSNAVADWSEMETCQADLVSKSLLFFSVFFGASRIYLSNKTFVRKRSDK